MSKAAPTLRLILGDQLNRHHSWFQQQNDHIHYIFMETRYEANYVRHHIQKIVAFFLAMRAFAEELRQQGHQVIYLTLDDPENFQSIPDNIKYLIQKHDFQRFEYQFPDEYRLDVALTQLCETLPIATQAVDSEHFLTARYDLRDFFKGKKTYLMESFYRAMRKKHRILMEPDGVTPLTGRWNYDAENRKKLPDNQPIPNTLTFERDATSIVKMLENFNIKTLGKIDAAHFSWAVTREENLQVLQEFVQRRLAKFGDYQDAMTQRDEILFHSRLSFALNTKQLHPLEVINTCIEYALQNQHTISFSALEGFIRQIIGWREYMRGVYWAQMPSYRTLNYFNHHAPLPDWYWTGATKMNCLQHAINQSLNTSYAHHIQRLMVTGNFALLLGCNPDEVDAWYLGIYIDAIEWVEITNTRGMSQFADGGIVGTKPYVSSANYIDKMSDYCQNCFYNKKQKYGERACPFNSLYWDFYDRHADKLAKNPRIGMMYRTWEKMDSEERARILQQAAIYKNQVNES
ncbi:MAG: cryptochrome/photolyase family protein [Saprospiraceae bacterium]